MFKDLVQKCSPLPVWASVLHLAATLPHLRVLSLGMICLGLNSKVFDFQLDSLVFRWSLFSVEELHVQCHALKLLKMCSKSKTLHID